MLRYVCDGVVSHGARYDDGIGLNGTLVSVGRLRGCVCSCGVPAYYIVYAMFLRVRVCVYFVLCNPINWTRKIHCDATRWRGV